MKNRPIKPPKNILEEQYNQYGVTITSLAKQYNTSNATVRTWLKDYNIPRKSHKEVQKINGQLKTSRRPSKGNLQEIYSSRSIKQCEQYFGVGQATIYQWLQYYNIPIRSLSDSCKIAKEKQYSDIRYSKHQVQEVYHKYKNIKIAAEELNISHSYLRTLLKKYNIETYIPWRSKKEHELFEYCKQLDQSFISNDKSLINPYELDIISYKHRLAIEYCGLYWHSEYYGEKDKNYHFNKYQLCKEKDFSLITVSESDDLEKIKALIRTKIGKNKRIGARETWISSVDVKTAREFHQQHHIHNSVGGSIHLGLYHNLTLVMVLSIGKARFNKNHQYECTRMTSHSDYTVIGGASKLFKCFIDQYKPENIVTFADLRIGDGNVYQNCGFDFEKISPPNYWYFHKNNPKEVYSRVMFQKHKLKEKLSCFDSQLTEYQNMLQNKYDRIWDCGNAMYVYKK